MNKGYIIHAYEMEVPQDNGTIRMDFIVKVTLRADNEEEAIKKAKTMVKRKYYRIGEVFEVREEKENLYEDMAMTQLEIQTKMLKFMEGAKEK